MKKTIDVYDKRAAYDEQMKPLINELLSAARKNNLPIVVSVAVANDTERTEYETHAVLAITELSLFENRIANALFLMNDFYADAPEEIRDMVRRLINYMLPSLPDIEDRVNVRLTKNTITEAFKALCHQTDLRFPKGVFPSVQDIDSD